jgi:hypothetical protein
MYLWLFWNVGDGLKKVRERVDPLKALCSRYGDTRQ